MARPLSASLFQHVLSDARSYYLALWEQLEPDARERLDAIMLPLLNQLGDAVYFKAVVTDRPYNPGLPQKVNHHDRHRNDMFTIEMHGEVLNIRGMQTLVDWTALTESYIRSSFHRGNGSFSRRFLHPKTGKFVQATVTRVE